jgi:hypothetical protein
MTPGSKPVTDEISRRIAYDKSTARSLEGTYLFDGARAPDHVAGRARRH